MMLTSNHWALSMLLVAFSGRWGAIRLITASVELRL